MVGNKLYYQYLFEWFEKYQRKLPWREKKDWYERWISEIMLQQTQVEQVIDYFNSFISRYPTIHALAGASLDEVMKSWEGLGYYARAQNLYKSAQLIDTKFNGVLPANERILKQLPGFGTYTINALLSIVFNQPFAVVDGNILRIITRLYAIKNDIRLSTTRNMVQKKMNRLIYKKKPGLFNEAMMELGATICIPKNPLCNHCPIIMFCRTYKQNLQNEIPFKSPPPEKPYYSGFSFILYNENKICIAQRPPKGLLAGLWEFPTFTEKKNKITNKTVSKKYLFKLIDKETVQKEVKLLPVKHSYTHFNISIQPYLVYINEQSFIKETYDKIRWVSFNCLEQYAMHRAMRKILLKNEKKLKIVSP